MNCAAWRLSFSIVPFDQSINPYRGCEHGCIYCFARPTHAYWDMSPGLDFETRLIAKPNAPARLRAELDKPNYRCSTIALGVNTDAYQPVEKQRRMEPRTAAPSTRLRIVRELTAAGVPAGIIMGPVIPFVNDHELEAILDAASDAGATRASWIILRLPHEIAELFEDWLRRHFPDHASHVMNRIRDLRGGKVYDSSFGNRMTGQGPYADLIRQRLNRKARALGMTLHEAEPLRTDLFQRANGQKMSLL